jgi:hypothetical protein
MNAATCLQARIPGRNGPTDPPLDPYGGLTAVPVGEHTHAVAGAAHLIEAILNVVERNSDVDPLGHLVRRLNVQGQLGHNAKSAECDDRASKLLSIDIPPYIDKVSTRTDELKRGNGRSENALIVPRTVSAGRTSPGD